VRPEGLSMKNSNETIGNPTRDLRPFRAMPQPTLPLRTACYCVSTDIYTDLYNFKQSLSLLKEFRATGGVCLSICLPLKFPAPCNVLTVSYIGNNSKQIVRSRGKNSVLSYRVIAKMCFVGFVFWYGVKNNCKWKDGCETGNGSLKCLKMYYQIF
jgi:hypothetical protein